MKKTFIGGIRFTRKDTEYEKLKTVSVKKITLEAEGAERLLIKEGQKIYRGSPVFNESGTEPAVFSAIGGCVESVVNENGTATVVIAENEDSTEDNSEEAKLFPPLDKPLKDYSTEELSSLLLSRGVVPPREGSKAAKVMTVDSGGSAYNSSRLFMCINYPKQIVGGAKIIMKLVGARKCIFAIPSSCLDAARSIEGCLPSRSSVVKVSLFKEKYPDLPHLTVCATSNIEISANKSPENAGYPVVTPHICLAVYRALAEGIPLCEGHISITGADGVTGVAELPYGADLIESTEVPDGFRAVRAEKIIESRIEDGSVMKAGVEAIAVVKDEPYPIITERGCIGCRRCVNVCPGRLLPYQLHNGIESGKMTTALKNELLSCFECGCCSAVCPSCLPVYELISKARAEYLNESAEDNTDVTPYEASETDKTTEAEEATEIEEASETAETTEVEEITKPEETSEAEASSKAQETPEEQIIPEKPEKKDKKGRKNKKNNKTPKKTEESEPADNEASAEKADLAGIFREDDGGDSK